MSYRAHICEGNDGGSRTASCLFARFALEVLSVSHGNFPSRLLRSCWLRPPRLWQHPVCSSPELTKMPYSCSCHKSCHSIIEQLPSFLPAICENGKSCLRCKTCVNNSLMKPEDNEASEDKNKLGISWLDAAVSKKIFLHCKHNLLGYLSARLRVSHKIRWFTQPRLLSDYQRYLKFSKCACLSKLISSQSSSCWLQMATNLPNLAPNRTTTWCFVIWCATCFRIRARMMPLKRCKLNWKVSLQWSTNLPPRCLQVNWFNCHVFYTVISFTNYNSLSLLW